MPTIYGFNRSSEAGLDVFAPSIFLGGCNLRCPYCMNARLVKNEVEKLIAIKDVKKFVTDEKCKMIFVSGGEPTITPIDSLILLLEEIESWGCKVAISTNGTNPDVLRQIMNRLSYVAMDIKSPSKEDYQDISIDHLDVFTNVLTSKGLLEREKIERGEINSFDFEIRTTLFPLFIDKKNIREIGSIIKKENRWVLQQFRHSKTQLDNKCLNVNPYSEEEVREIMGVAREFSDNVLLRYV